MAKGASSLVAACLSQALRRPSMSAPMATMLRSFSRTCTSHIYSTPSHSNQYHLPLPTTLKHFGRSGAAGFIHSSFALNCRRQSRPAGSVWGHMAPRLSASHDIITVADQSPCCGLSCQMNGRLRYLLLLLTLPHHH